MAMIQCPECRKDISEKTRQCPYCNKRIKKNRIVIPVIMVILLFVACVGGLYSWKQYQKREEEKRQEQIESLLLQVDKLYMLFDFDGIEECYDELEKLHYDVEKQREILEYDRQVYPVAYAYYVAINEIDEKLRNDNYSSLKALVDKMKSPTENFEALDINSDSEIGKYIDKIRSNIMYNMFNSEFVNSTEYDLDYYLTSFGYATILQTYTGKIIEEKFPYIESQD